MLSFELNTLVWTWVTFGLLILVFYRYIWPALAKTFDERSLQIKTALDKAQKAREAAESLSQENKVRLEMLREEITRQKEAAQKEVEKIKAAAIKEAKDETNRFVQNSREQIEREKTKIVQNLKNKISGLIVEASEKIIERQVDPKIQEEIIRTELKDLETIL